MGSFRGMWGLWYRFRLHLLCCLCPAGHHHHHFLHRWQAGNRPGIRSGQIARLDTLPSGDFGGSLRCALNICQSLRLPSGELTVCYGRSPFLMGKSTISMAIFHCYVSSPEGKTSISLKGLAVLPWSMQASGDPTSLFIFAGGSFDLVPKSPQEERQCPILWTSCCLILPHASFNII